MAQRFAAADPQTTLASLNADDPGYQAWALSLEEFAALRVLFRTCAAVGLGFVNDW